MPYKIDYEPVAKLTKQLESVSRGKMAKYVLYPGAGETADLIRASLNSVIKNSDEGQLAKSLDIAAMRSSNPFKADTAISFVGYHTRENKNGTTSVVANAIIAAVLESGRSDQKRTPTHFFSKAVRAARKSAPEKMSKAADEYIDKIFN